MRVFAILLLAVSPVWSEPIRQPAELQPGDKYRLAFTTSRGRDALSTDIDDYNAFVQSVADEAPVVGSWGLSWRAIASTETVSARDNTDTNLADGIGVPIFRVDGILLVPNYLFLWEPLQNLSEVKFDITELGTTLEPGAAGEEVETAVWSGTFLDGTSSDFYLGSNLVQAGKANGFNAAWFNEGGGIPNRADLPIHAELPLYAISNVIVAVPEPSPSAHFLVSLIAMLATRRNWGPQTARRAA